MNLRIPLAGLLVAAVPIFLAGTASATTLTSPAATVYTGNLVAEAEGHVVLNNPIAKIECGSAVEGKVESHGAGVTAGGNISSLTFTGCTDSWHVTVVSAGSLEVHHTSGSDGTVTSSGATVEATRFGITCRYATSGTDIGTLTGGSPATLDISAGIPFHSGSIFCGSGATTWTGSYEVTTPSTLSVVASEVTKEVTMNGVAAMDCHFTKLEDKCAIKYKVTGEGEGWRVDVSKFIQNEGHFEATAVGCTLEKLLKPGESCTDVIQNVKNEKAEDIRCVEFEREDKKETGPVCTVVTR